jgi:hypothetical protein
VRIDEAFSRYHRNKHGSYEANGHNYKRYSTFIVVGAPCDAWFRFNLFHGYQS